MIPRPAVLYNTKVFLIFINLLIHMGVSRKPEGGAAMLASNVAHTCSYRALVRVLEQRFQHVHEHLLLTATSRNATSAAQVARRFQRSPTVPQLEQIRREKEGAPRRARLTN